MDNKVVEALLGSMVDLENATANFKGLLYGESGVGKTKGAMEIAQRITPADKRIAYFDTAEGWVSLLNHPGLDRRTSRFQYQGLSQLEAVIDAILEGIEPFTNFKTMVIDEATTVAKLDLDVVVKARLQKDKDKDPFLISQTDRGINTERMRRTFGKIMAADINVILVGHVRYDKNERTGVITTSPSFMPATSTSIRELLHMVAFMTATESTNMDTGQPTYERQVQVHPTRTIVAKSRVGKLGVHTTIEELCEAIPQWQRGERDTNKVDTVVPDNTPDKVAESEDSDDDVPVFVES